MERMPLRFVREYLQLKGRKQLEALRCTCGIDEFTSPFGPHPGESPLFRHPIRFLWGHIRLGHRPGFTVDFYWFWETGETNWKGERDQYWFGDRTYHYDWNRRLGGFELTYRDEDIDWS